MKLSAVFLALFAVALWGFDPAIGKLGLKEIPPFAFLTLRYALVVALFLPFAKPSKHELKKLFWVALTSNVVCNVFCYFAYTKLSPSASILLLQTESPIAILMACLIAGEKLSFKQGLSILFAFVGVVIVLGIPNINLLGAGAILVACVAWGICLLIFKQTKGMPVRNFLAYSYLFALPFVGLGSLLIEKYDYTKLADVNWKIAGFSLFYQVVLLSAANVIWRLLIAENGVNKIVPFAMLTLVFGIIGGVLIFDDELTWRIFFGAIAITLGVFFTIKEFKIVNRARAKYVVISRNARRLFMERKLEKMKLRNSKK